MSFHKRCLLFGGLLGGLAAWLSISKKGRETREIMLNHGDRILDDMKSLVEDHHLWEKMSESEYVVKLEEAVTKYANRVGLTAPVRAKLQALFIKHAASLRKELAKEKKNGTKKRTRT